MTKRQRILLLLAVSVTVGAIACFIPWGPDDGFHGKGIPIPTVIWDKASLYHALPPGQADYFIDFPNPLALILNPLAYLILLTTAWGLFKGIGWLSKRRRGSHELETTGEAEADPAPRTLR